MTAEGKIDLVQDVTEDCSVVASLCAITARAERGYTEVMCPSLGFDHAKTVAVDFFYHQSL
jgi:calpain-7